MGYTLGVDLGTTYAAAAICRDGHTSMVELGESRAAMPTALALTESNEWLVGEPAERHGRREPHRLAVQFKRRFGDSTPVMVGGSPMSADALMSRLLRSIVERVVGQEGEPPTAVAVTHPANWGPFKIDLLRNATVQAGIRDVVLVSEPEAAALHYAANERIPVNTVIAAYDLGGGTFDATVLRKKVDGFEVLGESEGIERLGGIDLDEAVLDHVLNQVPELGELNSDDPDDLVVLQRLRADCVLAKESLSTDTAVTISVVAPGLSRDLRLTRAELADMAAPMMEDSVIAMRRAIAGAGLEPDDVDRLILVGGSSRVPAISEALASAFARPISADLHPKHAVASGAAQAAHRVFNESPPPVPVDLKRTVDEEVSASADAPASLGGSPASDSPAFEQARRRNVGLLVGVGAAIAVVGVVAAISLGGGTGRGGDSEADGDQTVASSDLDEPIAPAVAGPPDTVAGGTPPAASVATDAPSDTATATPNAPVPEQCKALAERPNFGCIIGFSLSNKTVLVTYAGGESASLAGDYHLHFFGNSVAPEDAGAPSALRWREWDRPGTFAAQIDDPIWLESDRLCVVASASDHVVDAGSGHCVKIPADIVEAIAAA
jgi:molecular chaperone DnaK